MNLFNKTEAVGLFLSVAIMAVALSVVRFKTDVFVQSPVEGDTQGAVVAVSQTGGSVVTSNAELEKTLWDASTSDGELVKLVIDDITVGTGIEVQNGDTLTVHYVGRTQSGVEFGNSRKLGKPFVFTIGKKMVIEGWEKGILGMKIGGQRILVVPSEMAYGDDQVGPIAPGSVLVFEVELLKID